MKVVDRIADLRGEVASARKAGGSIEFVPTMGALHEGHLSLLRAARGRPGGYVVLSIFVNPLQFGPSEDLATYPRDLETDCRLAEAEGADLVFAPPGEEMFPGGRIETRIEVGRLGEILEGEHRPGHFAGVATVCAKLFHAVAPDRVYLGQKDAQQVAVLRQVVRDLAFDLEMVVCPTVREPDGLAMSSRNSHLRGDDRAAAAAISRGLVAARQAAESGETDARKLEQVAREEMAKQAGLRLQYVEMVHPQTFETVSRIPPEALLAAAARSGGVRLIDNCIVGTAQRPEREEDR